MNTGILMLPEIIAILLTWLFGPLAFLILIYLVNKKKRIKEYNLGINCWVGDTIFLAMFNAVLVRQGFIDFGSFPWISIILSIALTLGFFFWRKYVAKHDDWSRPEKGVYNIGGWYHTLFMLVQSFLVFYGILNYTQAYLLWIALSGYLLTSMHRYLFQLWR